MFGVKIGSFSRVGQQIVELAGRIRFGVREDVGSKARPLVVVVAPPALVLDELLLEICFLREGS
jgi:hypothetical protein